MATAAMTMMRSFLEMLWLGIAAKFVVASGS